MSVWFYFHTLIKILKLKKMKKTFVLFIICIIAFISCKNVDYVVIDSTSDSCKVLDLDPVFEDYMLTLYDIVDTMKVISLETTSESILAHISLMKISDDYIIINDGYQNGSIAIFDINGKFIRRIQSGNGPEDINVVRNFDVDDHYLYTLQVEKVNKYTLSGEFVESYPLFEKYNKSFRSLKVVDDGFLLCVDPYNSNSGKYEVLYTDKQFEKKNLFVFNHSLVGMSGCDDFRTLKGDVIFFPSMHNTVYRFDGNTFKPFYVFNYPKYENTFETTPDITESGLDFFSKHCIRGKFFAEGRIFQGNGIIFLTFPEGATPPLRVYIDSKSGNFRSGFIPSPNDEPLWPLKFGYVVCTYNDYFVQRLPPEYYLVNPKGYEDWDSEGKHLEESVSHLKYLSDEDKNKILTAKEDDNPMLILYKLKNIPPVTE